jgi:hypothetical protein
MRLAATPPLWQSPAPFARRRLHRPNESRATFTVARRPGAQPLVFLT